MINNECKFIPGRIYKNRVGEDFRFIAFIPDAEPASRAVFLYLLCGGITLRYADGQEELGLGCNDDILIPTQQIRVRLTIWDDGTVSAHGEKEQGFEVIPCHRLYQYSGIHEIDVPA